MQIDENVLLILVREEQNEMMKEDHQSNMCLFLQLSLPLLLIYFLSGEKAIMFLFSPFGSSYDLVGLLIRFGCFSGGHSKLLQ